MSLVTPIAQQREFWNRWNTETREKGIEEVSRRQAQTVRRWPEASGRTRANKGLMRYVNSRKLNAPVRAVFGNQVERLKERLGLGWTLMALARKRT